MSLYHFWCSKHVSDINTSIISSLRLFCWITTFVVLFLVRCVLEFRCGWVGVVSVLQAEAELAILFHFLCAQHVSDINISIIRSLRLFCWITTLVYSSWFDVCWSFGVVGLGWYPCCRIQPATWIPLHTNHTETPTHKPATRIPLQTEAPTHKPATRIPLQHKHTEATTHIEPRRIDQCGNSTE